MPSSTFQNLNVFICRTAALFTFLTIVSDVSAIQTKTEPNRFETIESKHGVTINVNGKLFAKYVIDQANKPYFWPIIGPTGKEMTRAYPMELRDDESKQHRDHPHHRGLLFGHENVRLVNRDDQAEIFGGNTWHEKATFEKSDQKKLANLGSIQHRKFVEQKIDTTNNCAIIVQLCDHVDRNKNRFLSELRRLEFRATSDARSIDIEQVFTATDGDVIFDDNKDAGLAIRVPTWMAMKSKQGGAIVDSQNRPVSAAWGQPSKWCDYHGQVDGEHLGIAFLCHPTSHRFPSRWHVREYGLFTANPFGQRAFNSKAAAVPFELKMGKSMTLKHRLVFHKGDPVEAKVEQIWQDYAKAKPNESK